MKFQTFLNSTDNFYLRRIIERLREGLFDPLGVQMLTSGEAKLDQMFDHGAAAIKKGQGVHQCICGSYGQGKSHSLNYLQQRALEKGFVASTIHLDPRKVPFHNFKEVYKALMEHIVFPGDDGPLTHIWKTRARDWLNVSENKGKTVEDLIPGIIPHRFRAVLAAAAQSTMDIPLKKRKLKKHAGFKPREFPWVLKNALMGKDIPVFRLRPAFLYRQVSFYKSQSLVCRTPDQYLNLLFGMAKLFQNIGFNGWVVLFDEGESICQTRITSRSKSYRLLDRLFDPQAPATGLYPVFAFTPDFFACLNEEPYDLMPDQASPMFEKNYAQAWQHIRIHNLHDLSSEDWKIMVERLSQLHAAAYGRQVPSNVMHKQMNQALTKYNGIEPRLKFKLMVTLLDLEQQTSSGDVPA